MSIDFKASIDRASDKLLKNLNNKIYEVSRQMFTSVVEETPSPTQRDAKHATGLLVNQWYPDTNGFSSELGESVSDSGVDSLARIERLDGNAFYKTDGQVSLTNNAEHAYRAEVLGWPAPIWAGVQGPYGMVGLALDKTVMKLKSGSLDGG